MIILGVMSGSSLDGLDVALIDVNETSDGGLTADYLHWHTFPLSYLKNDLSRLSSQSSLRDFLQIESDYSIWIAEQIITFLDTVHIKPDYLSIHGHTVSHTPEKGISIQLNVGGLIAGKTGIPTITDFRRGDIALGGKGTPLTPIIDQYLYSQYDMIANLGGICNVSYSSNGQQYGYDLFPCNQVSNFYANKYGKDYDKDGQIGSTGRMHEVLFNALTTHRILNDITPRAIDNEWIKNKFIPEIEYFDIRNEDKLYTFYHAFAHNLIEHAAKLNSNIVYISGGGIKNAFLRSILATKAGAKQINLHIPDDEEVDYRECKLMAVLAYLRVNKKTNILQSVTGATKSSIGGAIHL